MKRTITVTLDIDPLADETEVIIKAKEETETVRKIVSFVQQCAYESKDQERSPIPVYQSYSTSKMIEQKDIIRVYTEDRKSIVCTHKEEYQARNTLRELEEILDAKWFIRISRFEIINLKWVSGFNFSSAKDTMKVVFEDGNYSWVSRRFVRPVQKRLAVLAQRGGECRE